jgi:DNA repair protein RadA/Sms
MTGGLSVSEPALDLPLALAIASSLRDQTIAGDTLAFGEVSLLGEVRPVPGIERRLREAARLGFTSAIVPADPAPRAAQRPVGDGLEVIEVSTIAEALVTGLRAARGTTG